MVSARGEGNDRVAVIRSSRGAVVLIVADGSGGTSGASEAAERTIRELSAAVDKPALRVTDPERWVATLRQVDSTIASARGQCALALVAIVSGHLYGASVGDCCVWCVERSAIDDLSERQARLPLLGSGDASPVGFAAPLGNATLLVASDGLWKYAVRTRIAAAARGPDLHAAARSLVELTRLLSGQVPDDVAVVLCREHDARSGSAT